MLLKNRKILAIGGGEIGRPKENGKGHYPVETTAIDNELLKLTNNKQPTLLFIPTASNDSLDYYKIVKKHFLKLGFRSVDVLLLSGLKLSRQEIEDKILSYDAIYVGGGDTLKMMKVWKRHGVGKMLENALNKGIVLSGISAGSICWFNKGGSDLSVNSRGQYNLDLVTGLNIIGAVHCPHFDVNLGLPAAIKEKLKGTLDVAICLDNCAALEVVDEQYRIITSSPSAKAYRAFWQNGVYAIKEIKPNSDYKSLADLLSAKDIENE